MAGGGQAAPVVYEPVPGTDLHPLADELISLGVRRIHSFAWRDLDDPDAGGSEVHADHVFRRWVGAGLQVVHRTSTADEPRRFWRNGYEVVQRGSRYGVFGRAATAEVARREGRRDAVIEIWNGVPWISPLWARCPQVTWLHHVHGPMWDQVLPGPAAGLGRVLETRLAPPLYRGRPVVTLADASRDELVHLGFDPAFVHVVPPGIDPSFSPDPARRSPTPLVVTVGRLAPVKRFVLALAAAEAAHHRVPDLEVVVVGEGPDRPELERWIADRDAGGWVRLAGRIDHDELVDLYRRAWVALSASLAEGWGMTLTEAGACATPAVATDVVGHRGAVVPGITGELVETVADLGIVLADLLTEPTRRDRYGRAAAERARTLTWDRTAHDTLAILLNETRRRALAPSEGGG